MPINYSQSSGFSIPSTVNDIPDSPDKFEQDFGNITVQAHKKKAVTFLIGAVDFTMKLPPEFRSPEWFHYTSHTELTFIINPALFDDLVISYAQAMSIIIP